MPEDAFKIDLPDAKYMERTLEEMDRRFRANILRSALRAAAGVYRRVLRQAARPFKDSGDLARSVMVVVRRARGKLRYYALAGFRYGRFGDPPRTSQDPGVYSYFLEEGATRENRGRVRATKFASKAVRSKAVAQEATEAFAAKARERIEVLRDSAPKR